MDVPDEDDDAGRGNADGGFVAVQEDLEISDQEAPDIEEAK